VLERIIGGFSSTLGAGLNTVFFIVIGVIEEVLLVSVMLCIGLNMAENKV